MYIVTYEQQRGPARFLLSFDREELVIKERKENAIYNNMVVFTEEEVEKLREFLGEHT